MKLKDGIKPWLENIVRPILTGDKYDECCKCVEWIIAELGDRDTKEISLNTMVHFMNKLKGEKHLPMGFVETIVDVLEEYLDYVDKVEKEEWHDAESENNKKNAEKERGIMDNEDMKKESPGKEELETGWNYQLNKQLCELARELRDCVNEIKKVSYLYKGQICDNLQQISDFKTLLHTAQKGISSDVTKGTETCQKYLREADKQLKAFLGFIDYVKSHSDTVLKVIYGEENKKDVAWREKEKRTLYEKGMIGRKNEDGSWDIDNCRWTFEDHLIFAMGSDLYKDSKDLI